MAGRRLNSADLPAPGDRFVGRRAELGEVAALLATARLVTLTGPPGIGKTRLALETASRRGRCYIDGVRWVDVRALGVGDKLEQAVLEALAVDGAPGSTVPARDREGVGTNRLLLVLDACEEALDATAVLVDRTLRANPGVSIMTTSEARLLVAGERPWPVPPMRSPRPGEVAEAVGGYESVALFADRAAAVSPFNLTAEVAPMVADICRRLGGLPLAIELAARQSSRLSVGDVVTTFDDPLGLLVSTGSAVFSGRPSVRDALEASYARLDDRERILLRRLGVFVGGACLAAVEAVCGGGNLPRRAIFDLLGSLAASSLVSVVAVRDDVRYDVMPLIGHFARTMLAACGEDRAVRERHRAWCLRVAEDAEACLSGGGDQQECLQGLRFEEGNLMAAVSGATADGDTERLLRLVGALTPYWVSVGQLARGRSLVDEALTAAGSAWSASRAKTLWAAGYLAVLASDHTLAASCLETATVLFRDRLGDSVDAARCVAWRGASLLETSGPSVAGPLLEESLATLRAGGDWGTAEVLCLAASASFRQGDVHRARARWEEAIDLARSRHNTRDVLSGIVGLGTLLVAQGDNSALVQLGEALALGRRLGDASAIASLLRLLGELRLGKGEYEAANGLLEDSLRWSRGLGRPALETAALCSLGRWVLAAGDGPRANQLFAEALDVAHRHGVGSVAVLSGLGQAAGAGGDAEPARARLEAALTMARSQGDRLEAAEVLYHLGALARLGGDHERAVSWHHEALTLQAALGLLPAVAASLEALAGLALVARRAEHAARLFGAAESLREFGGYARSGPGRLFYDADVAAVRMAGIETDAAWAQGAALSVAEAVAYASRGRGTRRRARSGWESLSGAEQAVAVLAAEGLRNKEIAQRLFISPRTVGSHLSKAFAKLGVTSRTQLLHQVYEAGVRMSGAGPGPGSTSQPTDGVVSVGPVQGVSDDR